MKTALAALTFALLTGVHANPREPVHDRFCPPANKSLDCEIQRGRYREAEFLRKQREFDDQTRARRQAEQEERAEKERLRMIREKDCNPRVRRCD